MPTTSRPARLQEFKNFVNGEFTPTAEGRASDIIDPSTGEAYALAPVSGPADVDAALKCAEAAREGWRDATPAERSLALLKIADAIEARGAEIVAAGTPVSIGGRDSGAVTIRFALPDGVSVTDLPVSGCTLDEGQVEIHTEDELRVLHDLTGWAIERDLTLPGLAVVRVTLEDVYLQLTKEDRDTEATRS